VPSLETVGAVDGAPSQAGRTGDWFVERVTTRIPFCNYYNEIGIYSMRSYTLAPEVTKERIRICEHSATGGSDPVLPYAGSCPRCDRASLDALRPEDHQCEFEALSALCSPKGGSPRDRDAFRFGSRQPNLAKRIAPACTDAIVRSFCRAILSSHAEAKAPPQAGRLPEA
jgi:hypothetical protein